MVLRYSLLLFLFFSGAPASGEQATRFTLKTIDGNYVQIDDILKKGPVLITFWALWCKDCKEEMQALNTKITDELGARSTIIAVTIDTSRSIMRVKSYIAARKLKFLFCSDPNSELLQQFGGKAIPYTVIIDPDRTIALRHIGYAPGDEKRLLDLLREHSASSAKDSTQRPEGKR
jgi:cytochrome c biogenesis protein CcmG, thiol:disulfide interchange protein DsbE